MEAYPCKAQDLARYIVGKCAHDGKPISNLQLQKILYFLQTAYCKNTNGNLLFSDEFYAWPYGPVIPDVYRMYSRYGGRAIADAEEADFPANMNIKEFVDSGIEYLRDLYPWDLVKVSHAPNSPWEKTYKKDLGQHKHIPNKLIISYCKELTR